jgi:hypothetical protein
MKNHLLVLLLFFGFFLSPCLGWAKSDRPYFLAVFNGGPEGYPYDWEKIQPDMLYTGATWDDFPVFLELVRHAAKDKEIIIDVSSHGSDTTGLLYIDYEAFGYEMTYEASMGYIINEIEKKLPKVKALFLEACYSEMVMERSLTKKNLADSNHELGCAEGSHIEASDQYINFPVYGVGSSLNYNNTCFLQWYYNVRAYFYDLRQFINHPPAKSTSEERENDIRNLWVILSSYGL